MRQVVEINSYAVTTHQTGLKGQENPLGTGCFQDFTSIDVQVIKDHGQFVDEGNV